MKSLALVITIGILYNLYIEVLGHGSMTEPPARTAAWRFGFDTPKDYMDMAIICPVDDNNEPKCGVCGGQQYECPSGQYCKKVIVRKYTAGQTIPVTLNMNANHGGKFYFRVCPVTDENSEVTWDCLKKHQLVVVEGGLNYWLNPYKDHEYEGDIKLHVKLPDGLKCNRCVMQWYWSGGNRWGKCANGTSGLGCGPQETFINCADISIS